MGFTKYRIIHVEKATHDTSVLRLVPAGGPLFSFRAGQYCHLKNPTFRPDEIHSFSIASGEYTKDYVEFCIKEYGQWTKTTSALKVGDLLHIEGPFGDVFLDTSLSYVVFLVGGVGIAPVMSMIRTIGELDQPVVPVLLYGARTPGDLVYKNEIEQILAKKNGKVSYIFSHLPPDFLWNGHRGFITPEIITSEVDLTKQPAFYMFGPPIFVDTMATELTGLGVPNTSIHKELH